MGARVALLSIALLSVASQSSVGSPGLGLAPGKPWSGASGAYLGVTCGNVTTCNRVGLAVWLTHPATEVDATLEGVHLPASTSRTNPGLLGRLRSPSAALARAARLVGRRTSDEEVDASSPRPLQLRMARRRPSRATVSRLGIEACDHAQRGRVQRVGSPVVCPVAPADVRAVACASDRAATPQVRH